MSSNASDRSWNDPPVVKYEIANTAKKHHLLHKRAVEDESKLQTAKKHHLLQKEPVEDDSKLQAAAINHISEMYDEETKSPTSGNMPYIIGEKDLREEMKAWNPGFFSPISDTPEMKAWNAESVFPRSDTSDDWLSDEDSLSFIVRTFQNILDKTTNNSEKTTKDVSKRIDSMKDSWSFLSKEVKNKMYFLARDLDWDFIDAALKRQWSLSMENAREVKSWIVGVKHIIEMKKEIIELNKLQPTEPIRVQGDYFGLFNSVFSGFGNTKIPDSEDNIPDSEDNIPDSEDNIPDSKDNIPDSEDNIPDSI